MRRSSRRVIQREKVMLKTVIASSNKKTGPISVTYRSGERSAFGTCPRTCALNPSSASSSDVVDAEYLDALRRAVPRNGQAWTYSHFPHDVLPRWQSGDTVINASCDTIDAARAAVLDGRPAVYAAPRDTGASWPATVDGVRFVRCPAETLGHVTCRSCGNGRPLCARGDRNYVIVFVGHGSGAKLVGAEAQGGCYAANGPTRLQWEATRKAEQTDTDGARLLRFVEALPAGSMVRHHVAGDIGREA